MKSIITLVVVVFAIVALIVSCSTSDWYLKDMQEKKERQLIMETPHIIREADGCKVYEFIADGSTHYFTRCLDGATSIERTYEECRQIGKTRSCDQKSEIIKTEGVNP